MKKLRKIFEKYIIDNPIEKEKALKLIEFLDNNWEIILIYNNKIYLKYL